MCVCMCVAYPIFQSPFSGSNERGFARNEQDKGKVAYTLEEAEADGLLQVEGQSGLQSETLYQRKVKKAGRGGRRKSSRSSSRATSNTTAMPI